MMNNVHRVEISLEHCMNSADVGKLVALLFCVMLFVVACSSEKVESDTMSRDVDYDLLEELAELGQELFRSRSFGTIEVACADCHSDYDETLASDDIIRPGHSILGAHMRAHTWNGEFAGEALARTAAGAAKCAYLFQERGESLETALTSSEARQLMAFYEYVSTGTEALSLAWHASTWPGDPHFDKEEFDKVIEGIRELRGNSTRGKDMFRRACAACHEHGIAPAMRILKRKATQIPRVVRAGDGAMPFFSLDKLSDQDIADIQAYISD